MLVFSGTFDPIHYGHLRIAHECLEQLGLGQLRFVPTGCPPHRASPIANAVHRAKLVELAIAAHPGFILDNRETLSSGPHYTLHTLQTFRQEMGPDLPLIFLLGADAFFGLPSWHGWRELFDYCHLLVAARPGWQNRAMDNTLRQVLLERQTDNIALLREQASGLIYEFTPTLLDISASAIRQQFKAGKTPRYLLPDSVLDYIMHHQLY